MIPDELLLNKIFLLRKQKVMPDRDLAALYDVKPIRLREQVKRNLGRFPGNFMFTLNEEEIDLMVSQNAIPSRKHLGGAYPLAFTEHGILMLANVLKTERAIQVSIRIIEIFVKIRELLLTHKDILLQLEKTEKKLSKHDDDILLIFQYLEKLLNPAQPPRRRIGFRRKDEED
jgi:phage regulator Rha-like protein